jgi:hypothetical protein
VSCKSNTKFPFSSNVFPGVRGVRTSSCIVYDYTTIGHTYL